MKRSTKKWIGVGIGLGLAEVIKKVDVKKPVNPIKKIKDEVEYWRKKALDLSIRNNEKSDEILKMERRIRELEKELRDKN